jgi:hypothetical protein
MKTYLVTLKRESYITYTVEAADQEEAEGKAWEELSTDDYHRKEEAYWDLESIEEQTL